MRRHARATTLVAILGAALACGGGGSSSSGGGEAEITVDNATAMASDVLAAINLTAEVGTLGASLLEGLVPQAVAQTGLSDPMRGFAAAMRAVVAVQSEPLPSLPGGVTPSGGGAITQDCEGSGTVTVSGRIAGSIPTTGDRIDASFDDCSLEVGSDRLDGRLHYRVLGFTGDPDDLFSMTLDITFDQLRSEGGEMSMQVDGDAETILDNTASPLVHSTAEGTSLRIRSEMNDDPEPLVATLTARGYYASEWFHTDDDEYATFGDGQVSSSTQPPREPDADYAGLASYEVNLSLSGDSGELPHQGEVVVTGGDTEMVIVVEDETNLTLYLDLDDDGIYEEVLPTTWAALGF